MALKTWNGSNGNFQNPNDWTPKGVPAAGDDAVITNGTVRINNLNLTGVGIQVSSQNQSNPVTLDIHNSTIGTVPITELTPQQFAIADMNIKGTVIENDLLKLGGFSRTPVGSTLNMDIAKHSTFVNTGTIDAETGSTISVIGKGTFENNSTFDVIGSMTTVDTPITGTGTINAEIGIDTRATQLNIGDSVSAGETVNVIGNAVLQLSDTPEFLGAINFAPPPPPGIGLEEVILQGIASTSASYNGSVLSVFNGTDLVASLRVATPDGLTVTSSGGNTFITPDGPIVAAHALG